MRKLDTLYGGEEPPNKRTKDKETPPSVASSGKDTASSKTKTRGPSQRVWVQNGIYAAERLCSSFDVTHSINFILLGEIQDQNPSQ